MRLRPRTILPVLLSVALVGAAGACSSGSAGDASATATPTTTVTSTAHAPLNKPEDLAMLKSVTVTGDAAGKTPAVKFGTVPLRVGNTAVLTLKEGTGAASTGASRVSVRQALFLGSTGKVVQSDFESKDTASFLLSSGQQIPGIDMALYGVKAGSRILYAIPPADAFGTGGRTEAGISGTETLVVLADVISVGTPLTQATGTAVPPVAGQPTVTFDATKGPTITVPKAAAPTTLVSQELVKGTGATVKAGQTVTVQYTGAVWADGSVFDSSWTRGQPFSFTVGQSQVIPGWDKGLVGKTVGSRVLLVVPPGDGYGAQAQGSIPANSTLVFVVDILDAG